MKTGLQTALSVFGALALGTQMATAQAPEKGSPLEGRPETEAAQKLAPQAAPPLPTAEADLPELTVPDGFKVEVFASGLDKPRTLRVADDGTVFVSTWQGNTCNRPERERDIEAIPDASSGADICPAS